MSVSDSVAIPPDFRPSTVLVLSELSSREKEKYFQLLLQNQVKFVRQGSGPEAKFVGSLRLLAPGIRKPEEEKRKKESSNYALTFQERLTRLRLEGFIQVVVAGVDFYDYAAYPRFTSLIAFRGDVVRPKLRPMSWLMKHVEDIYDARFYHEKNEVEREDDSPSFDLILLIFPVFVVRRLGTNVGLKTLVDQTCWDLLYSAHVYRRDYLELEIFGRFLQEFYDHDDLLFYLYVRSVISKVLHINFKQRWLKFDGPGRQPRSQWMSYREAQHIARIVFGNENEDIYRDFMLLITPQMIGSKSDQGDSRRIDITEYLHLCVVGYHQSQQRNSNFNGERMLVPIPGQVVATAPVPMLPGAMPSMERTAAGAETRSAMQSSHPPDRSTERSGQRLEYDDLPLEEEYGENGHGAEAERGAGAHGEEEYGASTDAQAGADGGQYEDPYAQQYAYGTDGAGQEGYGEHQAGEYQEGQYEEGQYEEGQYGEGQYEEGQYEEGQYQTEEYPTGEYQADAQYDYPAEGYDPAMAEGGYDAQGQPTYIDDGGGAMNAFEQLQWEREDEFMAQLMAPLANNSEEVLAYIDQDLRSRLHETVSLLLQDREIYDLDGLDAVLLEVLQLDQLRLDMEALRDEIIASMMPQPM